MKTEHWLLALYGPVALATLLVVYVEAFVVLPELRALVADVRRADGEMAAARKEAVHYQSLLLRQQERMMRQLAIPEDDE